MGARIGFLAALLVGCSSFGSEDPPAPTGSADASAPPTAADASAADSEASEAGGGASSAGVQCGATRCSGATPRCCVSLDGDRCIGKEESCSGTPLDCDDWADCGGATSFCCLTGAGASCTLVCTGTFLCDPAALSPCPPQFGECTKTISPKKLPACTGF